MLYLDTSLIVQLTLEQRAAALALFNELVAELHRARGHPENDAIVADYLVMLADDGLACAVQRLVKNVANNVYIFTCIHEIAMPQFAKVFRSGNSQAVRLPKDFRFDVEEVEVSREGDAVILRPRRGVSTRWASLRAAVDRGFSAGFMAEGLQQPDNQSRPELDEAFG
jgi:antitoxin VapB